MQKDGGTMGGIDLRMMSDNVQPVGSGVSAPTVKITDWAAEWETITRQCSQAQIDHKKFRDFSAACFAQPEGKAYQQRVIALALQLLKSEESAGIDSSPELKETLLILG
jgi:hypothetical protein